MATCGKNTTSGSYTDTKKSGETWTDVEIRLRNDAQTAVDLHMKQKCPGKCPIRSEISASITAIWNIEKNPAFGNGGGGSKEFPTITKSITVSWEASFTCDPFTLRLRPLNKGAIPVQF
jgi:hypothetical protein